jgi:hypothetical protein
MAIKWFSGRIPLGQQKSLSDLMKEAETKKNVVKTASAAAPAVKVAEKKKEKDEAESSGQPEAEGKLTNDPKVLDEKKAATKKDDKKKDMKKEVKKDEKKDCMAEVEVEVKVAEKEEAAKSGKNEKDEAESSGQLKVEPLHQKGESVKPSAVTDKNKKTEAVAAPRFIKISNLNSETKTWLKEYFRTLFPEDYVEALVADK